MPDNDRPKGEDPFTPLAADILRTSRVVIDSLHEDVQAGHLDCRTAIALAFVEGVEYARRLILP